MKIGIVVGEKSGDNLGAGLFEELKKLIPNATIEGVIGPKLLELGGDQWTSYDELSFMGIIEPLKALPRLIKLRKNLTDRWINDPPDVFIGVDAPEFNLTLEKNLKKAGIKTIHYVSPSIWAWRKNRVKKIKKSVDKMLCILPFEPLIYDKYKIPAKYIGHPLAETIPFNLNKEKIRYGLGVKTCFLVAILPGSRVDEIRQLGPIFVKTAKLMRQSNNNISFIAPMASNDIKKIFNNTVNEYEMGKYFNICEKNKFYESIIASDIVISASGTAVLESALLERPTIAAYKISSSSYFIMKALVKTKYFTLPNILLKKNLIPEYIQNFDENDLHQKAFQILSEEKLREAMVRDMKKIRNILSKNANCQAAHEVVSLHEKI
ncbi:MAG: lipid-A-disaccharide synthase [Woeseiaceae bacterium]|nr:lipid-A-disaccharide synthase [Woeseiaceae bacterium]|tara:strand:- start:33103 stop:34236 length:1134 start_codon:yes stop_codon:yes gene_type:complete